MPFIRHLVVFTCCAMLVAPAVAADKKYGVEISPNGDRYAVLQDYGDQRALAIYEVDNIGAKPMAIGLGKAEIEDWEWGGDDYLLVRAKGEKGGIDTVDGLKTLEFSRWLSISRLSGTSTTLFGNEQGADYYFFITAAGTLLASLPAENQSALFGRHFVKWTNDGPSRMKSNTDQAVLALQKADLKSGASKRISSGNESTIRWVVDANGDTIARVDKSEHSGDLEIFAYENGKPRKSGEIAASDWPGAEFWIFGAGTRPDTIQIALSGPSSLRLMEYDLNSGAFIDDPFDGRQGQLTTATYDPRAARIRFVRYFSDRERFYHFDAPDAKLQAALEKALPGASVGIESKSLDSARLIAHAIYADRGDEFYFFDTASKRLELVAAN